MIEVLQISAATGAADLCSNSGYCVNSPSDFQEGEVLQKIFHIFLTTRKKKSIHLLPLTLLVCVVLCWMSTSCNSIHNTEGGTYGWKDRIA